MNLVNFSSHPQIAVKSPKMEEERREKIKGIISYRNDTNVERTQNHMKSRFTNRRAGNERGKMKTYIFGGKERELSV